MTTIVCPRCSRAGTLQGPPLPGKLVRCPGCGERFEAIGAIPAEAMTAVDLGIDLTGPSMDRGIPLDDEDAVSTWTPSPRNRSMPTPLSPLARKGDATGEPWSYRFLDVVSGLMWVGGVVFLALAVLMLGLIVLAVVLESWLKTSSSFGIPAIFVFGWTMPLGILLVVLSAFVHLTVDHARNGRATRQLIAAIARQSPGSGPRQ